MSRTLWIGDVQDNWTEDYLCELMRNAKGLASIKLMRDRQTNEPQGYGFIDFATEEDAINALNGYNGRPIPGTGFTFRLNFGGNNKTINAIDNYCVYIGDLELSITDSQLYQIFKEKYISFCGAKIMRETNGVSKGFGFIQFRARDEAETALKEMNGYVINGKPIRLSYASARRWLRDDEAPRVGSGNEAKYDVIMEGPEIPNVRPPPPTAAMIAKSMANSSSGSISVVDVYGNAYENPMFSFDPVYRSAVEARMQKKMRMNQKKEAEANDIEAPNDRFKPFNIVEENRKYMQRASVMFDIPSLTIPKYKM